MSARSTVPARRRALICRGFTLLELLVVIGIIALLGGILIVSLSSVRGAGGRAESVNALRQMIAGYSNYSTDNKGRLMPGYVDETTLETEIEARIRLESGNMLFDPVNTGNNSSFCSGGRCDASAYVWRLLPYLDFGWESLLVDYDSQSMIARIDRELTSAVYGEGSAGANELGLSAVPSFGLNSIYVGGDTTHGSAASVNLNPWAAGNTIDIAATRLSEVKNPAKLIVFAPVGLGDTDLGSQSPYVTSGGIDTGIGYMELRAPFLPDATGALVDEQWTTGGRGLIERSATSDLGNGAGLPITRWGVDQLPLALLDGSTGVETLSDVAFDMSRWSPFALNDFRP